MQTFFARRARPAVASLSLALTVALARAGTPAESNLKARAGLPPFQYSESPVAIPNYLPGEKWGTQGEAISRMQLPLPPAESARHVVVPEGFSTHLWAAEPDIVKPICMAFDERGRLWIAETVDYPNELQPAGAGRDRITICEDTNGDGKADKFTVFADKLSIPTGMVFANGGVIVVESGHTLFLKDNDGDGKADERRVLFSGWGTGDTHATASNLRYGPDNWIWGVVGYSGFDGEVGANRVRFGQGVYRFKPDGSALEFVRSSNNNTWGLGFSEDGIVFGSTANNNASWYMAIPNRYYEAVSGWSSSRMETIADKQDFYPVTDQVRQVDAHGRYTAGAGHALYTARSFPRDYWNRIAFVAEPTGHLVGQFRIDRHDDDFSSANLKTFLGSDDGWCAPIMAEVGPDGALWVLDWYNYIIQHNPTPHGFNTGKGNAYDTPLRDKRHGRIYRVTWDAGKPAVAPKLAGVSPSRLVSALRDENQLERLHAQRLLVERGNPDVAGRLIALVSEHRIDTVGLDNAAFHALWTLHGLGVTGEPKVRAAVVGALKHPAAGVRRAAIGVLPRDAAARDTLLSARVLDDADAQVRLAALLALAEMPPDTKAGEAVFAYLQRDASAKGLWLVDGATAAAARNDAGFLRAALAHRSKAISPSVDPVARTVTAHYASRAPADSIAATLAALDGAADEIAVPVLDGLASGWPTQGAPRLSDAQVSAIRTMAPGLSDDARAGLIALLDKWGQRDAVAGTIAPTAAALAKRVTDTALPDKVRVASARRWIAVDDSPDAAQTVLRQIGAQSTPAMAGGFLSAVGASRRADTAEAFLGAWPRLTPAARRSAISSMLRRPEWARSLLAAVEQRRLDRTDIGWDQWAQLREHPDKTVATRAASLEGGSATASGSAEMEAVIQRLLPVARKAGDIERGRKAFETTCMVCHAFNGKGARVGPDLTGIGARPKTDLLVEIVDPNRSVEANYRAWTLVTKSGDTLVGRLDTETATSVELMDTTGQKHSVQRRDIQSLEASNLSLMPAGFDQLPPEDLGGILEYLASGGKH